MNKIGTTMRRQQKNNSLQARIAELEKERTILRESNVDLIAREAETRVRAEAAEKLAGDAIDCLRTLADRVSRGQNILINPGICLHANALLSSPAAEQARERAEALANVIARAVQVVYGYAHVEVLQEALQRLDALDGERR